MKPTQLFLATAIVLMLVNVSAAPFQNLGFEDARTNSLTPIGGIFARPGSGTGPISDLLPGWQLSTGTQSITTVGFNYPGGLQLKYQTVWDARYQAGAIPYEGRYALKLTLGTGSPVPDDPVYYLTQRAEIPADARLLTFVWGGRPWIASINGEDVARTDPASSVGMIIGDISRFAGQTVELAFRTTPIVAGLASGDSVIDAITFLVPEPSTYALLALGASTLVGRWLWRRRRRST